MPMGIGKLMDSALADSDKDNENGDGKSAANKKSELTKIALLLLGGTHTKKDLERINFMIHCCITLHSIWNWSLGNVYPHSSA